MYLNQVKLVPVNVRRAKLFVSGHIRKNIESASHKCDAPLHDRVVDLPFTGFADLTAFINFPIIGIGERAEANFLNERTNLDARLDKYFFKNLVKNNEQPFGELVDASFFELDFSPKMAHPEETFSTLREKIVVDLTLKVFQLQQLAIAATAIVPALTGLTPPVSHPATS